jgi:hypothetical protein
MVRLVPVLTVTQILIAYSNEGGVHGQLARKTIESGRVPGNRCYYQETGCREYATSFSEGRHAVGRRRKMVERPHEKYRGREAGRLRKPPSVRD